jgi:hypothetical protein
MKKLNPFIIPSVAITLFFIFTNFAFAGNSLDAADGSPTNAVYVDNDGKVGIGTTTPGAQLDVAGELKVLNGASAYYGIGSEHPASGDADVDRPNLGTSFKVQRFNYHSGLSFSAHSYYGGIRFYNQGYNSSESNPYKLSGAPVMTITGGKVGIGTSTPSLPLDIQSSSSSLFLNYGSTTQTLYTGFYLKTDTGNAQIWKAGSGYTSYGGARALNIYNSENYPIAFFQGTSERMRINGGGNVGIGTTTPDYKLDVLGTIRATEIKVATGWSDFVFDDNYNLPSIDEVKSYIEENKHLPDIPSAKEIQDGGLSVADMMAKQMQKIEELTLYVIEHNKQMAEQNKRIEEMKEELAELKKMN